MLYALLAAPRWPSSARHCCRFRW